jgi:uncharacterized membrane protein
MNQNIFTLFLYWIMASFIGWLFEAIIFNKYTPDNITKLPILPIYGFGFLLLYFISSLNISLIYKILLSFILVNSLECIGGLLSLKVNGYHTWNYKSSICKGYISWYTAVFWLIIIILFNLMI